MTAAGKLLVFLNLFAAVALLTWAGSLSANRLDWVDRKDATGKTVPGRLAALRDQITEAGKGLAEVSAGYAARAKAVADTEADRDARRAVFEVRLTEARSGTFKAQVPLGAGPLLDTRREGPPVLDSAGRPLRGADALDKDLDAAIQDAAAATRQSGEARAKFNEVTIDVNDMVRRVADQRVIAANLGDELKALAASRVNWDEELRTLRTRQGQLVRRLDGR